MSTEQQIILLDIHPDAKAVLFALLQENNQLRAELEEQKDRLVKTDEACEVLGCGRAKMWKLAKREDFPKPVQFGKTNYYRINELIAFRKSYQQQVNN
ncbi:helix-turn-helix transcriptional regulator [Pseudoalteromonas sp. C12FD-1]|uniref:helix-turn-helix transcriptional regulator n=1 Tax=Pseudoalteromonas sp. C12FD-1 TaxID=3131979 RepID=UPI00307D9D9E